MNTMKTILSIVFVLITLVSFSQKQSSDFKVESTLNGDGSITKTITVSSEPLSGYVGLKARVNDNDTSYFFFYKDQRYTRINSYQTTEMLTKKDVVNILNAIRMVKNKSVDNAVYSNVTITRYGLGSIQFNGPIGYSFVNISNLDSNFNSFIK